VSDDVSIHAIIIIIIVIICTASAHQVFQVSWAAFVDHKVVVLFVDAGAAILRVKHPIRASCHHCGQARSREWRTSNGDSTALFS
jgi:hypothetical protein